MSAEEERRKEERAFEALIVSQMRAQCSDRLEPDKLPELSAEEEKALDALGEDLVDRLLAKHTEGQRREKPRRQVRSEGRELVHGLNRAEEIDEETDEELKRKREEALRELEEKSGDDDERD